MTPAHKLRAAHGVRDRPPHPTDQVESASHGTHVAPPPTMATADGASVILERLRSIGVSITEDQLVSFPPAAQRRLSAMPCRNALERRSLAEVARWLIATFPPGWRATE